MKGLWACVLLTLATVFGCSKHSADATQAGPQNPADAAPPSPREPGFLRDTSIVAVVNDTGNPDATLAQLTSELRRYVMSTRSVPRSFEEFAAKSNLQAPAPPAGKKYAIQGQAVVLVKR